jgi:hypothetical protein
MALVFYFACTVGGTLLWRRRRWGVTTTALLLLIQVPAIRGPGFSLQLICGAAILLGIVSGSHDVGMWIPLGSSAEFRFALIEPPTRFAVNVLPLAFLLALRSRRNTPRKTT